VVDVVPGSEVVEGVVKSDKIAPTPLAICATGAGRLTDIDSGGPKGGNASIKLSNKTSGIRRTKRMRSQVEVDHQTGI
jgi:hypothetical protein